MVAQTGNFNMATRQKRAQVSPQGVASTTTPLGSIVTFPIPRVGLLSRLVVSIRYNLSTVTAAPAPAAALIKRVRLFLNGGIEVINISGLGYHYGLASILDGTYNPSQAPTGVTNGNPRSSLATGTGQIDLVLPIAMNLRDTQGLLMLQNEQLTATLTVEFEVLANLGTTLTFTACTTQVYEEWFTLPQNDVDMPPLNTIHRVIEEELAGTPSSAADFVYVWPRGNRYLQMVHVLVPTSAGILQVPTDTWTRYKVRVNTSDYLYDFDNQSLDIVHALETGQARNVGAVPLNLMGSAGLGMYDQARDTINSADYTDLASILSLGTYTGLIKNIRREIMVLPQARR